MDECTANMRDASQSYKCRSAQTSAATDLERDEEDGYFRFGVERLNNGRAVRGLHTTVKLDAASG